MKTLSKLEAIDYIQNSKATKFNVERVSGRTSTQNAYLWYMHRQAVETSGYTPDELHKITSEMFIESVEIEYKGIPLTCKRTTRDLNITEFSNHLKMVRELYEYEFDCYLPSYEEYARIKNDL